MLTLQPPGLSDVQDAAALLKGAADLTPCARSAELSALSGADVVLKYENLQRTGSFKARGAFVKLQSLDADQRRRGVIAASAGNHAQGVAYHAQRMGIAATIVMPTGTPETKIRCTEQWGARIELRGQTMAQTFEAARALANDEGLVFVHPFDDPQIIAGCGTVALEMLNDFPDLDVLIAPVGGGGLISGMALAAKAINPRITVIGAQIAGRDGSTTVAEGIAIPQIGELPQTLINTYVDEIVTVSDPEIEHALHLCLESLRTVVEGAGAAAVAALLSKREALHGKRVGLVLSGGNIDTTLLSSITARARLNDGRVVRLRVQIVDVPGGLSRVAGLIAENAGNIIEVVHQRALRDLPAKCVALDITVDLRRPNALDAMIEAVRGAGFPCNLLAMTTLHD